MSTLKSQILSSINSMPGLTRADLVREFPNIQGNTISATLHTLLTNGEINRKMVPNPSNSKSRWTEVGAYFPKGRMKTSRTNDNAPIAQSQPTTQYKIESNVAIPSSGRGRPTQHTFPFAQMNVGDSFVGPMTAIKAAYNSHKSNPARYTSRKLGEDQYRVWRIK